MTSSAGWLTRLQTHPLVTKMADLQWPRGQSWKWLLLLQKYWKELLTGFKISLNLILTPRYDLHKQNDKIGYFCFWIIISIFLKYS